MFTSVEPTVNAGIRRSAQAVCAEEKSLPAAVIFTHSLLPSSCTFIRSHADALVKYTPVYVGAHRVKGIDLTGRKTYVVNEGTPIGVLREATFRLFGWTRPLARQVKRHNPHVVHAHFGTSGPAALALARALDVPLVVTFHGNDATLNREGGPMTHRDRELVRKKAQLIEEARAVITFSGDNSVRNCLSNQDYADLEVILHRKMIHRGFSMRKRTWSSSV